MTTTKWRTFASELPEVSQQQMHSQLLCGPQGNKYKRGRHPGIQSSVSHQSRVQEVEVKSEGVGQSLASGFSSPCI